MPHLPSSSRRLAALAAAACLALLAACDDDGLGPEMRLAGERYRLARANGQPLPALLWQDTDGRSAALVAEELTFEPLRMVRVHRTLRLTDAAGVATTESGIWRLEYRLRDGRIELGSFTPCPPNAACIANDVGTLHGDAIVVESGRYSIDRAPALLRYDRVPDATGPVVP